MNEGGLPLSAAVLLLLKKEVTDCKKHGCFSRDFSAKQVPVLDIPAKT